MTETREPRICIEDLPDLETLTAEEAERVFGAGRFQPRLEGLEDRYALSTVPAMPAAPVFTQALVSPTQIDLSFSAVPGATGYEVGRVVDGVFENLGSLPTSSKPSVDLSATPGTNYDLEVFAVNAGGGRGTAIDVTTPQAAPAAPVLSSISTTSQITVSFKAVANATSYVLQGEVNGNWVQLKTFGSSATGSTISQPIAGLNPGTTYSFRVYAVNSSGANGTQINAATQTQAKAVTAPVLQTPENLPYNVAIALEQANQAITPGSETGNVLAADGVVQSPTYNSNLNFTANLLNQDAATLNASGNSQLAPPTTPASQAATNNSLSGNAQSNEQYLTSLLNFVNSPL